MYIPMIKLEFILVNFQWDTLSVAYQPSDFACEEQRAVEKWYKTIQNTKIVHGKFACWTIYIYTLFFFLRLHSFVVVVVDCTEVESGSTIEVRPIYLWIGMFYFYILSLTLFCIFVFFFSIRQLCRPPNKNESIQKQYDGMNRWRGGFFLFL